MEGNLYQLTKSRKGRPLAAGLIASCFHQIVGGLNHIHNHGYFHRDMKPENLLVTTTGLCDYLSSSALAEINARRESGLSDDIQLTNDRIEKDVQVIVKLADFGLARAIASKPPYTEYVSTRWYRAPEVLLRSTEYGAPVDMWALGTILAEMVNLKPLFPGVSEIDQVYRICDTLGDPSEHGFDDRGKIVGGGRWSSGVKLAKNVGFSFPKRQPANFRALFPKDTPDSLIDCIADLLRYDPKYRLNSAQCLEHPYYMETLPHLQHVQPLPHISFVRGQPPSPQRQSPSSVGERSRQSTPTHMPYPQEARPYLSELRIPVGMPIEVHTPESMHSAGPPMVYARPPMLRQDSEPQSASTLVHLLRALDLPTDDLASYGQRGPAPADELAINASRRPSLAVSHHEGSAYQGSVHSSHPGYGPVHPAVSSNNVSPTLPSPVQTTNPHVAAYVLQQQQQAFERQSMRQVSQSTPTLPNSMVNEVTPRVSSHSTMTLPMLSIPPTYHSPVPSPTQVMSPKPMMPGKKKKWGLSSVFGGGDKHDSPTSLSAVDERELSSSAGLKRTQSGHYAGERSIAAPAALDPKQSKKLAEREKRELQKAKREAAERAQQERARAVLQKRSQLVGNHAGATEFEYNDAGMAMPMASLRSPLGAPKSNQSPISLASPRTHGVHPYGLDTYAADGGRNKARKTAEDDDHSSIGRTSSHSRSLLSVGTVDSDPGPRRGQQGWMDPMVQNSRRTPSHAAQNRLPGGPRSTSSLMTHSTISLESQLASQIARHASGQSASESSLSVGHRAGHSLNVQMPMPAPQAGASAPTSPYGQPGVAGYPGHGVHRSGKLPSINDWAGSSDINPMFKVVSLSYPRADLTVATPGTATPQRADHTSSVLDHCQHCRLAKPHTPSPPVTASFNQASSQVIQYHAHAFAPV